MTRHWTTLLSQARRRFAGRPWAYDVALGAGLTTVNVLTLLGRHPAPSAGGVVLWGAQTVPLFWRSRHPRAVLAAMTAAFVLFEVVDPIPGKVPGPYLLVFGVYAVARHTPPRDSLIAVALSGAAAAVTDQALGRFVPPQLGSLEPISVVTFVVFYAVAWLLGYGRRRIDSDARRLRVLNERLRVEQEINARHAVEAERSRIARDLHDVVAHHVSAIAVQARSTEDVLDEDPRLGRQGVERIAATADTALVEMRRILHLLADAEVTDDPEHPEPSLHHLDRLVATVEATGCRVRVSVDESLGALPQALQVSAYRIVQESLTNVLKHAGPCDVALRLENGGGRVTIDVRNGPAGPDHRPVAGSGRGLIGLRERAAAFGGTLDAGPCAGFDDDDDADGRAADGGGADGGGGGWRVRAVLPYGEEAR